MFDTFKKEMKHKEEMISESQMLSGLAGSVEDDFIEATVGAELSAKETTECNKILEKIPEAEYEKEDLTDDEINKANKDIHEPTIEELAESLSIVEDDEEELGAE